MNSETNISYDHQCRLISEFLKDSFPSLIAFGSIGITYFATAQRIQDYLCEKSGFVERVSLFKNIIEESTCFNIWFFFCLCSLFIYSGISIINKKSPNYSLKILLLVIVSLLFLWYENEWVYAKFFFIDYRWLTTIGIIVLSILCLHSLFKWVNYIFKEYKIKDSSLKPFSNDLPLRREDKIEPCNLSKFIHYITTLLSKFKKNIENKDKQKDNLEKNTSQTRRKKAKEIVTKHRILAKYIHFKAAFFRKIKKCKENKEELQNDNNLEKNTSQTRRKIAKEIVNRLSITPVQQESYAICISGAWGSGKTSFLNYLKDEIIKSNKQIGLENNIIEFHPWRSSSSSLIIDDFFNLLKKYLKGKIPGVEDDLITYIDLLLKFDEPTVKVATPFLDHLFKHNQKEIDDSKRVIAEQLSYLNHKIYIFIDDIDRLESNEVLSVLRLIRNSANFPNLVFIAALDKQYVCDNLDAAKFRDGKSFLEKIFQVEFALPRVDNLDFLDLLLSEIRLNLPLTKSDVQSLFGSISNTEEKRYILYNVITNFRIAKRFIRQFSVIANYMISNFNNREFDIEDLFFLEMLHYSDSSIYDKMVLQPDLLFEEGYSSYSGSFWYLEENNSKEISTSSMILNLLFSKNRRMTKGRLALKSNYYNYFCLLHTRNTVRIKEFRLMIKTGKDGKFNLIEEKLKSWCRENEKARDSMDSINNGFKCTFDEGKKHRFPEIKPYLVFAIYWAFYEQNYHVCIVEAINTVLNGNSYANFSDRQEAKKYFEDKIRLLVERKDADILHLVWVLSRLYRFDNVYRKYLVENSFIKEAVSKNCLRVFMSNKNCKAHTLLQNGTPLNLFASYAVVENKDNHVKSSLVIDSIIDYYSKLPEKSRYYYTAIKNFTTVVSEDTSDPNYSKELESLTNIFGSEMTILKFNRYIDKCLDKDNAVMNGVNQLEDNLYNYWY